MFTYPIKSFDIVKVGSRSETGFASGQTVSTPLLASDRNLKDNISGESGLVIDD